MSDLFSPRYYTGVGSRDITQEEYRLLKQIGTRMSELGYWLRSGAADGSDSAFQHGACYDQEIKTEIWIPWKSFQSELQQGTPYVNYYIPTKDMFETARNFFIEKKIIPWYDNMPQGPKALHGRNYYQVVGFPSENNLSKVCIYCADESRKGDVAGGTRSAVMVARYFSIPTYNIRIKEQKEELLSKLKIKGSI